MLAADAVIVFDHDTARQLRSIEPAVEALVVRLPDLLDARDIGRASNLAADFRRISESVAALAGELKQCMAAL